MKMTSCIATATVVAVLGWTSAASAESARMTAIRERLQQVDSRANDLQNRVDRSPPELRREVERVMIGVARDCRMVTTRLAIIALLGKSNQDGRPVDEMEKTLESVGQRVSMVEGWYSIR